MSSQKRIQTWMVMVGVMAWACGGGEENPEVRDLTLAPAESIATLSDAPAPTPRVSEPSPSPAAAPRERPAQRPQPTPPPPPAPTPRPPAPAPAPPTLTAGTAFTVFATDTLTSRHNNVGDPVMATVAEAIRDAKGTVIIPAGAVFVGRVSDLAPAESPGGEGRMMLTYDRVEFGGQSYGITAQTTSLQSRMKGRGVTAGDAAKVGVGAVVGGIAGRVIGGNKTGTIVGAAAGAAAGVGIAAATRDIDIILDAGAAVELSLTAPFILNAPTS